MNKELTLKYKTEFDHWFWNDSKAPVLAKLESVDSDGFNVSLGMYKYTYMYCEPFIGELPTALNT